MRPVLLVMLTTLLLSVLSCNPGPPPAPPATPAPQVTAGAAGWQQRWEKVLTEAKKEGQVLIYSSAGSDVRTALTKAFGDRYGIELNWVVGMTPEIARKLVEERRAGIQTADAVIGGGTLLVVSLKTQGLLSPIDPFLILPEVRDGQAWRGGRVPFHDQDRTGIAFLAFLNRDVLINTNMMNKGEITTFNDLLNAPLKGRIVFLDPTVSGNGVSWTAILVRNWGLEPAKTFLRQLAKQEPVITRDWRQQVEWVAREKYPVALGAPTSTAAEFILTGVPLAPAIVKEKSKLSPGIGNISISAAPVHPNATTVFLNWLLSREGQTIAAKAFGLPTGRTDVPAEAILPIYFPGPGDEFFAQDEEDYLTQVKMLEVNKEIFGPLLK